jgi:hypothetical protein
MSEDTKTLYRPVGPVELALIRESEFRAFPPRLPEQPIFYPVLNEEYAVQIARDWNAKDPKQLAKFEVKTVGGRVHQEYWIPAEELDQFNSNIVGKIEVIAEFHAT